MSFSTQSNSFTFHTQKGEFLAFPAYGILKIRNIRYAFAERFQKPISLAPTEFEQILTDKTVICPQNINPLLEKMIGKVNIDDFEVDETPLFLTINRPLLIKENEKLPVIIWIHGGSYEIGCGDLSSADAADWVREQNVIIVNVTYRLGVFGFLGGTEEKPANLGVFDVIEALKWIKSAISDFGGEAENITLFGQSSGGDAIAHLMISEGVDYLFKRVIIQSAPFGLRDNREKMMAEFLLNTQNINNETQASDIVEMYPNGLPSFVKYGLKAAMPFSVQFGFPPLCKQEDTKEMWKKNAKKYDVLLGLNEEETALYLRSSEKMQKFVPKFIINKTIRATTESIYEKPALKFVKEYAEFGGNVYYFKIKSGIKNHPFSAAHAFDLPLVFGNEKAWENSELTKNIPWNYFGENGKKIRALWTEFAKTGHISDTSKRPDILELRKF
ncbi:carboxylesterase family protein [Chryseobacterium sp.]|uniref:carboxylesterase family protein n=1 Tax=Chryseobacterium sp. TaxID=1871047 RepID=UPI00388DCA7E